MENQRILKNVTVIWPPRVPRLEGCGRMEREKKGVESNEWNIRVHEFLPTKNHPSDEMIPFAFSFPHPFCVLCFCPTILTAWLLPMPGLPPQFYFSSPILSYITASVLCVFRSFPSFFTLISLLRTSSYSAPISKLLHLVLSFSLLWIKEEVISCLGGNKLKYIESKREESTLMSGLHLSWCDSMHYCIVFSLHICLSRHFEKEEKRKTCIGHNKITSS